MELAAVVLVALAAGLLAGWLAARDQGSSRLQAALAEARADAAARDERLAAADAALRDERQRLTTAGQTIDALRERHAELGAEHTALAARADAERRHAAEKYAELQHARAELSNQFKSLAADILDEKSRRFAEVNEASIGQLLLPLKTQLSEFKGKVEEVYVQEGKDRSALSEQVRQLALMNQTLSQDAKNLTSALKGQAKTQGNWGELILERVLESAGLRKGHDYTVQERLARDDGSIAQPDVVIRLPEERRLVVDAKASLVAYERYVSAAGDDERALALRQHLDSVRSHVKGLSGRRYEALYGLQSLDFVIAFVPIEPAFMLAVTSDDALLTDAWQRNVLLVSPSTLLFVVRTVAHLWRQVDHGRNAHEIAKKGADLYEKLCGFVADLEKVGERLAQARNAYDDAHAKLVSGKGNAIRQAQMLLELGVKPSKSLPPALVEAATAPAYPDALAILQTAAVPRELDAVAGVR